LWEKQCFVYQVRKEKMGDRITALQQLVSPFGKVNKKKRKIKKKTPVR